MKAKISFKLDAPLCAHSLFKTTIRVVGTEKRVLIGVICDSCLAESFVDWDECATEIEVVTVQRRPS